MLANFKINLIQSQFSHTQSQLVANSDTCLSVRIPSPQFLSLQADKSRAQLFAERALLKFADGNRADSTRG